MQEDTEKLSDLLRLAWGNGDVPAEEAAIAADLDPARVRLAQQRLTALLRYEGRTGDRRFVPEPGLSRATFFALLKAWRERRSLASIVPRVAPHSSGSRQGADVERVVEALVREQPERTRLEIAEAARQRLQRPPAASTLVVVVDEVRKRLERADLGFEAGFGRRVVVDASPAAMRIGRPGGDADEIVAWVGFVQDVASDVTVGVAAAATQSAAIGSACSRAIDRLAELGEGGVATAIVELQMHRDSMSQLRDGSYFAENPAPTGAVIEPHRLSGRRSEASRISGLLGRRFSPVTLRPRAEPSAGEAAARRLYQGRVRRMDARLAATAARSWEAFRAKRLAPAVDPAALAATLGMVSARLDPSGGKPGE